MSGTDQALSIAEADGKHAAMCLPDSQFSIAFSRCEDCLSIHATETKTAFGVVASLDPFSLYCNSVLASDSSLQATISIIQASLCSVNNITSDCPTSSSRSVTVATISSKPAAVSTSVAASSATTNYSAATTLPLKSASAIAGVAVACTLAVVFIIALVVFLCFQRCKRHKQDKIQKAETANRQEEKAQLHSEDLKPIRKELSGDQPLVSKKDVPIAEMSANEDPQRTAGEMPANEAVGSELPGESNEERSEEKRSSNTVCQSN